MQDDNPIIPTQIKKSPSKNAAPNQGRRERVRTRYLAEGGFNNFAPHEVLEFILFGGIPRKDTNRLAHNLITKFGTLDNVLGASLSALLNCGVSGMTKGAAMAIHCHRQAMLYVERHLATEHFNLDSFVPTYNYVYSHMQDFKEEHLMLIAVDKSGKLIKSEIVARGTTDSVAVYMRTIIKFALDYGAQGLVVAHNHPSGIVSPSMDDNALTQQILTALATIGVKLLDHIIVSKYHGQSFSYFKQGTLRYIETQQNSQLSNNYITIRQPYQND